MLSCQQGQIMDVKRQKIAMNQPFGFFFSHYEKLQVQIIDVKYEKWQ